MSISRPYRKTCRQLADGSYANSGHGRYVEHAEYAKDPEHYVRAFLLIQKDLMELFDYLEPAEQNLGCYSFRIHELMLRACVEVEANCKAILLENGYEKKGDLTMSDYKKIDASHTACPTRSAGTSELDSPSPGPHRRGTILTGTLLRKYPIHSKNIDTRYERPTRRSSGRVNLCHAACSPSRAEP